MDTKKSTYSYDAFDSEGYSLNLTHIDDNLTITVKAPMKLGTITWPTGTAGDLLPEPSSTTGKFNYEHDTNFSVYVGDTSKEEYDEYVADCSDYGFDVDYDKGENYYRAYNEDGYYLSLSYEGNNIMLKIHFSSGIAARSCLSVKNDEKIIVNKRMIWGCKNF